MPNWMHRWINESDKMREQEPGYKSTSRLNESPVAHED